MGRKKGKPQEDGAATAGPSDGAQPPASPGRRRGNKGGGQGMIAAGVSDGIPVPVFNGGLGLSGRPKVKQLVALKAQHGLTDVITLLRATEPGYEEVASGCRDVGLGWHPVPLSGKNLHKSPELWEANAQSLRDGLPLARQLLARGRKVLVHCAAGMHRTGIFSYGVLRTTFEPDDCLELVKEMRQVTWSELLKVDRTGMSLQEQAHGFYKDADLPEFPWEPIPPLSRSPSRPSSPTKTLSAPPSPVRSDGRSPRGSPWRGDHAPSPRKPGANTG